MRRREHSARIIDGGLEMLPLSLQDSTGDNIEQMPGTWRKRGLIAEPCQCADQCEQVETIDIWPRPTFGLGADKETCSGCAHGDARSMEGGIWLINGGHQHLGDTAIVAGDRDRLT